jgi:hypothetical protein
MPHGVEMLSVQGMTGWDLRSEIRCSRAWFRGWNPEDEWNWPGEVNHFRTFQTEKNKKHSNAKM